MYEFHSNAEEYFNMQCENCEQYVIPFIEEIRPVKPDSRVLEIGCGSAGVLYAFLKRGCSGAGIDIDWGSIEFARKKLADFPDVKLLANDVYLVDTEKDLGGKFDLIILKDVIEHIHNQERLIVRMKELLNPGGMIFFGFPPWQMPFGGHQQVLQSRVLSHAPYIHLLPRAVYGGLIKMFGDKPDGFLEIQDTGISIERFERIVKAAGYSIANRQFHLINPIYKYKFGLKMRKQSPVIAAIPYLRNFLTTSVFYLIKPD